MKIGRNDIIQANVSGPPAMKFSNEFMKKNVPKKVYWSMVLKWFVFWFGW